MLLDFVFALALSVIALLGLIELNRETLHLNAESRSLSVAGITLDSVVAEHRRGNPEGRFDVNTFQAFQCEEGAPASSPVREWCDHLITPVLSPPVRVCADTSIARSRVILAWNGQPCSVDGPHRVVRDLQPWL
ncbi:hypothetical protein NOR51B_896 [Luminiphilus syltensis NOR5-1B]|uniref:Uncharacterized protein n=1 Tax=Luminiphilus syltensis NOR5-1B TaxID=565045 RepID=B8KQJ1_9GAMM|nr:hypothetical protein [Luminiphilus syltensis]EED34956.1 hypothetical protein NOR51B_896 [Luminiphilus syltensis NOR5-1B]